MGSGLVKLHDKTVFKLRWQQSRDHKAFNNLENVWTNSCSGLPQQADIKKPEQMGKKNKKVSFYLAHVHKNSMVLCKQLYQILSQNVHRLTNNAVVSLHSWVISVKWDARTGCLVYCKILSLFRYIHHLLGAVHTVAFHRL